MGSDDSLNSTQDETVDGLVFEGSVAELSSMWVRVWGDGRAMVASDSTSPQYEPTAEELPAVLRAAVRNMAVRLAEVEDDSNETFDDMAKFAMLQAIDDAIACTMGDALVDAARFDVAEKIVAMYEARFVGDVLCDLPNAFKIFLKLLKYLGDAPSDEQYDKMTDAILAVFKGEKPPRGEVEGKAGPDEREPAKDGPGDPMRGTVESLAVVGRRFAKG